jgi:hypothetical protein
MPAAVAHERSSRLSPSGWQSSRFAMNLE